MRIKLTEGAEGTRLPSWRPPQVAQLTAEAKQVVTVVVSEQTRALNATLTRSLSDIANVRLQDVLTQEDRLLIAWVGELARAEGLDGEEVGKLTADLARYRAQALAGQSPALSVENARRAVDSVMLSLPRFSPREEAQARAILFGLATTHSALDVGFVNALLDPELRSENGVSLGFLQRIVAALPPGTSERLAGLDAVYARRDARATLSSALEALALPAAELAPPTQEHVELGSVILRERAAFVTPRSPWQLLTQTTRNERALLGLLYVSQEARAGDLRQVDEVARALVMLRSGGATHTVAPARARSADEAAAATRGRPAEAAKRDAPAASSRTSRPDSRVDERAQPRTQARVDERAPSRMDERAQPRADERAPWRTDERAQPRADERAPSRMDERARPRADERAPSRMDERAHLHVDERAQARGGERTQVRGEERAPARLDERAPPRVEDRARVNDRALRENLAPLREPRADVRAQSSVQPRVHERSTLVQDAARPRTSAFPVADPDAPRTLGSAIHLAAKAAVAYRSVAPPRPISVPPPASLLPPPVARADAAPSAAAFNLAQALGLSALVADAQTQAMRARRRRFVRSRERDDELDAIEAASAQETAAETERDPAHVARRHARWRRLVRRRLARQ